MGVGRVLVNLQLGVVIEDPVQDTRAAVAEGPRTRLFILTVARDERELGLGYKAVRPRVRGLLERAVGGVADERGFGLVEALAHGGCLEERHEQPTDGHLLAPENCRLCGWPAREVC